MADAYPLANDAAGGSARRPDAAAVPQIVIQNIPPKQSWLGRTFFRLVLVVSILANLSLFGMYSQHFTKAAPTEVYKDGDRFGAEKIALIKVDMKMITRDTVTAPKKELKYAEEDDAVKAVVLIVDCPGGTISGSDELYQAVRKFKEKSKKPLIVSMQGVAASGAYYVSMPADKIFAERSCVTGSIGVIASLFEVDKLFKSWGITPEVVKSGKMKDTGSPFRAMNDDDRKHWKKMIDAMYEQFLEVILTHRKDRIVGGETKLRELADGRTYLATEAKQYGLIDEIGYQDDAIEAARQMAGLGPKAKIIGYSRPIESVFDLLMGEANGSSNTRVDLNRLLDLQSSRLFFMPNLLPPAQPAAILDPTAR